MKKVVFSSLVLAAAMAAGGLCWRLWAGRRQNAPAQEPVSRTRFLDPYTRVYQTDDLDEGRRLAAEPGYWPVPQGLIDSLAKWNEWKPRENAPAISGRHYTIPLRRPSTPCAAERKQRHVAERGRRRAAEGKAR